MKDNELRESIKEYKKNYGTSNMHIAKKCGISREHFSRWFNNDRYKISKELKTKIATILNE